MSDIIERGGGQRIVVEGGRWDGAGGTVLGHDEQGRLEVQLDSGEHIIVPVIEQGSAGDLPRELGS